MLAPMGVPRDPLAPVQQAFEIARHAVAGTPDEFGHFRFGEAVRLTQANAARQDPDQLLRRLPRCPWCQAQDDRAIGQFGIVAEDVGGDVGCEGTTARSIGM